MAEPNFVVEGLEELLARCNGAYLLTVPLRHLMKKAGPSSSASRTPTSRKQRLWPSGRGRTASRRETPRR
jgi:hypothetical protein